MNCTKIHYLLSLNLDGRLSSSKRELLLDHLDSCSACRDLDAEMRAAQDLALDLPNERLSASFQDTLWDRVRSGEGSPEGVFREHVPFATRVRYVATGAAAAAAFLVTLNMFGPDREAERSAADTRVASTGEGGSTGHELASRTAQPALGARGEDGSLPALLAQPVGLSPTVVAESARETFVRSFRNLKGAAPTLREQVRGAALEEQKRSIEETIRDLRASASLMLWMADGEFIQLPGRMHAGLELARRGSTMLERSKAPDEFLLGLEQLEEIETEEVDRSFSVVCCDRATLFVQCLSDQISCAPETGRVFRSLIVVGPDDGFGSFGAPRGLRVVPNAPAFPSKVK